MDKDIIHPGVKSVGWALVQAARLHRSRTGDKLSELGLFAGQEQVLQALASSGPMTMGDLAAILRVRPPTASKTVSRLSSLKLIERHTEPGDARVVRVKLTKEGKRKAAAIDALWDEVEAELLAGFDNKERKRLRKLLRKAAKNLAGITGADQTGFDSEDDLEELGSDEPELAATA
ncbi:MAG TPA: MarR family winged helix-turn-helix transcriptional regulator [Microvirga sp.]|nr:MarR family winged helix-turn-helix transcriptional regulator [Microvirga sp.]